MSSGFVSGGTADAPIERDQEWLAAQQQIEATRRRKDEESRRQDGRSLFEVLEANKAAKEEAFQEATRLKNQFRALDEDEAEFLDTVLESTRAEEARVKKETAEGLQAFRKQQEADKKAMEQEGGDVAEASPEAQEEWVAAGGRKRKRAKEKEVLKGVKARRSSTSEHALQGGKSMHANTPNKPFGKPSEAATGAKCTRTPDKSTSKTRPKPAPVAESRRPAEEKAPAKKSGLGLVEYGSDEDD